MNTPPSARHPRGLYVLFFTEMWERFGYYLMIGILLLFLRDTISHGGKGMDNALSADIVGTYVALVYLTPFIGGLIADRYLGYRRAILLGGSMMALGYFLLAIPGSNTLMFSALACVIVGNGFFKPNISTLLGNIYNTDELKPKKDSAYNIFYMGINIGAFVCNFVAAYLRNHYGWGHAFAAAGVGMVFGLVWFLVGMRHVKHADVTKPQQPGDMPFSKISLYVFAPALIAGAIGWFVPTLLFGRTLIGSASNDAFIFASVPVIGFYLYLWLSSNPVDKRRIGTLLTMFGVAILFWNIYNQNATALTIWADNYTHREMPAGAEKVLKTFDLAQTVDTEPKDVAVLDEYFRTRLGPDGKVITHQGVDPYFLNLPKAQWPAKGENLKLLSTELYQSINPFWIIMLTPVVVGFFGWMRARNKEPSTPSKIAWGIIISGISALVMVGACLSTNIYRDKVSSAWIFSSYGIFTISELMLSPIGLSLVSKVAPKRITALMMGGWFLTTSLGGKISGILAGFWDQFENKALFFGISAVAAIIAGIALLPLTKRLSVVVDEASASND
ncbi:MAG: amino acid transporter [Myxococcales bacterium]|nr:amino acid transporter [Myxococcales bacterium]